MGLGTLAEVSLAAATKDREKWAEVLRGGKDPTNERLRQFEAERAVLRRIDPTYAEAAAIVFEAKKTGLRGDGEPGRWLSPITVHVIPMIGKKRISQLHQRGIHTTLTKLWRDHPATAEKALQRRQPAEGGTRTTARHPRKQAKKLFLSRDFH